MPRKSVKDAVAEDLSKEEKSKNLDIWSEIDRLSLEIEALRENLGQTERDIEVSITRHISQTTESLKKNNNRNFCIKVSIFAIAIATSGIILYYLRHVALSWHNIENLKNINPEIISAAMPAVVAFIIGSFTVPALLIATILKGAFSRHNEIETGLPIVELVKLGLNHAKDIRS